MIEAVFVRWSTAATRNLFGTYFFFIIFHLITFIPAENLLPAVILYVAEIFFLAEILFQPNFILAEIKSVSNRNFILAETFFQPKFYSSRNFFQPKFKKFRLEKKIGWISAGNWKKINRLKKISAGNWKK